MTVGARVVGRQAAHDRGLGLTLKPGPFVALAARVDRNQVTLPASRFTTRVVTVRADGGASLEGRVPGILRSGSDLLIVLNRGWLRSAEGNHTAALDRVTARLQYTFRL